MKPDIKYVTWGPVRRYCGHKHRTIEMAEKCLFQDKNWCKRQGGYSDRNIYRLDCDGRRLELTQNEYDYTQRIL